MMTIETRDRDDEEPEAEEFTEAEAAEAGALEPVRVRAVHSFVLDELDMKPEDGPREIPARLFDLLSALGLVERA